MNRLTGTIRLRQVFMNQLKATENLTSEAPRHVTFIPFIADLDISIDFSLKLYEYRNL